MFLSPSITTFLAFLILGMMTAISSNSWVMCWIGLEINLMSITPILAIQLSPHLTEATIKYFLTQAMASMMIIVPALFLTMSPSYESLMMAEFILMISLLTKAGIPPFFFWFPQVMLLLKWTQAMIMLTIQKIAPMILLSTLNFKLISGPTILATLTGAILGFNQMNFMKLLTFSSINHSAWMLMSAMVSMKLWMTYFTLYSIILMNAMIPTMMFKATNLSTFMLMNIKKTTKVLFSINMMSMAGLPPFLGFFIKLVVIQALFLKQIPLMIIMTLIMASILTSYFYTRVIYSFLMMTPTSQMYNKTCTPMQMNLYMIMSVSLNMTPILLV